MTTESVAALNRVLEQSLRKFAPPKDETVSQWIDENRRLSPEVSAEAGPWRTDRTPYLREPMDCFTDPKVRHIVMVSASQVGKSEFENNLIEYIIANDPGPILFIHANLDEARKFSRLRIAPLIRDNPAIEGLVKDVTKGRDNTSTVLQKSFPGGMLTMVGANAAPALASMPVRYVVGDERDRWPLSAGNEGDPWLLAMARQATFFNAKAVEVSTPTVAGASAIAASYDQGTRERWHHQCPHCGQWIEITFDTIRFDKEKVEDEHGRLRTVLAGDPEFFCPECGCTSSEDVMRRQPQKWIAEAPEALEENGCRSFWLSAFASPWMPWKRIVTAFLEAEGDPMKLQVVFNTLLGKLWEDRGELPDEDEMLRRREDYGTDADGHPVEIPDGVLLLTCGVDTQDDRLEYEVVGHGQWHETWGIEKGVIYGRPNDPEVWQRLDAVIDKARTFKDGMPIKVSLTCVDSGGHYTKEVYEACRARLRKGVVAIKGKGGDGIPFTSVPSKIPIGDTSHKVYLYTIGVDAGKAEIMARLEVQNPGDGYCHFPRNPDAGYDANYFDGLISEHLTLVTTGRRNKWAWVPIPGHKRNEALDCRNYALAAVDILNPPWDRLAKARTEGPKRAAQPKPAPKRRSRRRQRAYDDW